MKIKKSKLGIGFVGGGFITRFHLRSWVGVRGADVLGILILIRKRQPKLPSWPEN